MSDHDYCYPPDFTVLRNKLDIRDSPALEAAVAGARDELASYAIRRPWRATSWS